MPRLADEKMGVESLCAHAIAAVAQAQRGERLSRSEASDVVGRPSLVAIA